MGFKDFDETTQQQLLKEDSEAWNSICSILIAIIGLGLGIAFLAIFLVRLTG